MTPHRLGPQADAFEDRGDALAPLLAVSETVDDQSFLDRLADRQARVERRERILEDELHVAPERAHFALGDLSQIAPFEFDLAGVRLDEAYDEATRRRLAATALADQPQRLALVEREGDVLHRMHPRPGAPDEVRFDGKILAQAAHLQQRRFATRRLRCRHHAEAPNGDETAKQRAV